MVTYFYPGPGFNTPLLLSTGGALSVLLTDPTIQSLKVATAQGSPVAGTRGLVVWTGQGSSVALAAGSVTGISGTVLTRPGIYDQNADAYAQIAVGVAAVQVIGVGTLPTEVRIKCISAAVNVFIGFDNLVTTLNGYELEKLGVDNEMILEGFNGNLWAIASAAGGNLSAITRQ